MLIVKVLEFKFLLTNQALYGGISSVVPSITSNYFMFFFFFLFLTKSSDYVDLLTITYIIISAKISKIDYKRLQQATKRKGTDNALEAKKKRLGEASLVISLRGLPQ